MQDFPEDVLATIQYTIVERFIQDFKQCTKEARYSLSLSKMEITSNAHRFSLDHLYDLSYKPFTNGQGFLYLHTNQGVFSFVVSSNPETFIRAYQMISSKKHL